MTVYIFLISVYNQFCYADTDSIHITGTDIPDIEVDGMKLYYWKLVC